MRHSLDVRWIDKHLEEFVRPYLGKIPVVPTVDRSKPCGPYMSADYHIRSWTPFYLKALLATWREAFRQAKGKPILLAGRDTWLLEVMARLHGHETNFRPEISSYVATHYEKHPPEDFSKYYLIDTGYSGSIPRKLKITDWHLISYSYATSMYTPTYEPNPLPVGASKKDPSVPFLPPHGPWGGHQIFPLARVNSSTGKPNVRGIASMLEGCPKYWNCGAVENGKVLPQTKVAKPAFEEAAILTMFVFEGVTGTKINKGASMGWVRSWGQLLQDRIDMKPMTFTDSDGLERCALCFSALQATVDGFSCPTRNCSKYHVPRETKVEDKVHCPVCHSNLRNTVMGMVCPKMTCPEFLKADQRCESCFSVLKDIGGGMMSCPVLSCINHKKAEGKQLKKVLSIFVLDDAIRQFPRAAIITLCNGHRLDLATSVSDGKNKYKPPYDIVILDHDMHGFFEDSRTPNSGFQFACWLIKDHAKTEIILHSQNPAGRRNMRALFNKYGWLVHEHCFGSTYLEFLKQFIDDKAKVEG